MIVTGLKAASFFMKKLAVDITGYKLVIGRFRGQVVCYPEFLRSFP
jgi:hypothetical protein